MEYTITFTFTTEEARDVLERNIAAVLKERGVMDALFPVWNLEMVDLVATRAMEHFDADVSGHKGIMMAELLGQALIEVAEERARE